MSNNNICQSCGIPLRIDPENGGTEKDGSKTQNYCSYCYQKGNFTSPDIDTAKKMQDFCVDKMKEKGMSTFVAWIFTRSIPKLKRWKNKK